MEAKALEAVVKFAGLGGVAILVLWFVYRAIIGKDIFPKLSRQQGLSLLRWLAVLTFVAVIAGIGAYVYIAKPSTEKAARLMYRSSISDSATKQPIKGATVSIRGRTDFASQSSNEQGFFTLELPTADGKFDGDVQIFHADYEPTQRPVKLQSDKTDEPFLLSSKPLPELEWSGVVRDAQGIVVGAIVLVEGLSGIAKTDQDGRFSLKVKTQQATNFLLRIERGGKELWRDYSAPGQNITICTNCQ